MGVIHKLKPEIRDFILAEKKKSPEASCRSIATLVESKFQAVISKSSINSLFKEAGLSMPVGRRQKKRRHIQMPVLPMLETVKKPVEDKESLQRQEEERAEEERIKKEFERKAREEIARLELELKAKKEAEEAARRSEEEKWARFADEEKRIKALQDEALQEFRKELEKERQELEAIKKAIAEEANRRTEEGRKAKEALEELRRKEEAEQKAREEAEERARQELEEKAREEEARRQEQEKWERKAREEAEAKKAESEALKRHVEDIKKAEEERERLAEEEKKAAVEAILKQEEERKAKEEGARRQEEEKRKKLAPAVISELPAQTESTGAIILKAAEYLAGVSSQLSAYLAKTYPEQNAAEIRLKADALIYSSLFEAPGALGIPDAPELWPLVGKKLNIDPVVNLLGTLQENKAAATQLLQLINGVFIEARYIKIPLPENKVLYIDGQFHSIWSSPQIPFDFSSTYFNVKEQVERNFLQNEPLNIFMAPGYDIPTKEIFDLVVALDSAQNRISKVILCGNKFEEIETIAVTETQRRSFIFGLWPWQFVAHRKVNKIASFNPYFCPALNRQVHIAYIELELTQPLTKQYMALSGFAVKLSAEEKARVVILSNMMNQLTEPASIVNAYFNHWPNLEEGFQDFSRKIEAFTYTGDSQRYFSPKYLQVDLSSRDDIKTLFRKYLDVLDLYIRWHLLPAGWEEKDSALIKQRLYNLKAELNKKGEYTFASFKLPPDYAFAKELQYLRARINEREVKLGDGSRLMIA